MKRAAIMILTVDHMHNSLHGITSVGAESGFFFNTLMSIKRKIKEICMRTVEQTEARPATNKDFKSPVRCGKKAKLEGCLIFRQTKIAALRKTCRFCVCRRNLIDMMSLLDSVYQ